MLPTGRIVDCGLSGCHLAALRVVTNFSEERNVSVCLSVCLSYTLKFKAFVFRAISDIRRGVNEICALLGCYTANNGSFVTDVCGQPIGLIFFNYLTLEDGTDKLPRNVGYKLPFYSA
jgi:hypothetical protein